MWLLKSKWVNYSCYIQSCDRRECYLINNYTLSRMVWIVVQKKKTKTRWRRSKTKTISIVVIVPWFNWFVKVFTNRLISSKKIWFVWFANEESPNRFWRNFQVWFDSAICVCNFLVGSLRRQCRVSYFNVSKNQI